MSIKFEMPDSSLTEDELRKAFVLRNSVAIVIPSTFNAWKHAPELQEEVVDIVSEEFAKRFGGVTVTDGQGGWHSTDLGMVWEGVKVVTSYHDDPNGELWAAGVALWVKGEMRQEAVALVVDGSKMVLL